MDLGSTAARYAGSSPVTDTNRFSSAPMAESADAVVSKATVERRGGSSPLGGTIFTESIAGKVWSPPAKRMNRAKPTIGFRLSCSPPFSHAPLAQLVRAGTL